MNTRPFVAFDLTRLFVGPLQVTPRGIDRVELGYADHFLKEWSGDAVATLPTPFGARTVRREDAVRIIESVQEEWGERNDPDRERLIAMVKGRLEGGPAKKNTPMRRSSSAHTMAAIGQFARRLGCIFGPLAENAIPKGALYLNTGQIGIAVPQFLSWLTRRPDIHPVFMLHDVIPIDNAQYVPAASSYFHKNMIANTAAHAAGLIVTTKSAGAAICRELRKCGRPDIPVIAEHLPVPPLFTREPYMDRQLTAIPYFVVVGSIEPRKNHLLLLKVWSELVRSEGPNAPKLVIAGTHWRGHGAVSALLEESAALRNHVVEVSGLPTPSLHRLLSNARGLLMPSFAEGFGLPIIEALALGVPVIASDIAAHREAGGDGATYLDATDCAGWAAQIRAHMRPCADRARVLANHRPRTWSDYLRSVEPFLTSISQMPRSASVSDVIARAQPEAATA